ncbi:DUF5320 domain-containing protein [Acinetobacter gyllenbergii]|uniref:DUF5320 domain-containing protein n=1 Tax=Acinetobacter gyllenbergii TaxID=134534 RepID=UPI003AF61D1F
MTRQIKTPGAPAVTQPEETKAEEQTTAQKADEALEQIKGPDDSNTEPTQEELLQEQVAALQEQLAELKKSTQVAASANGGAPTQAKKRIPHLTKDGWTTKEAD